MYLFFPFSTIVLGPFMNCWVLWGIGGKKGGNIKLSLGPSMNCWVLWGIDGKKGGNRKLSLFAKNLKFRVGYKLKGDSIVGLNTWEVMKHI